MWCATFDRVPEHRFDVIGGAAKLHRHPPSSMRTSAYSAQGEMSCISPWAARGRGSPTLPGVHHERAVDDPHELNVRMAPQHQRVVEPGEHRSRSSCGVVARIISSCDARRVVEADDACFLPSASSIVGRRCGGTRGPLSESFRGPPFALLDEAASRVFVAAAGKPSWTQASQFPITTAQPRPRTRATVSAGAARGPRPRNTRPRRPLSRSSSARTASSAGRLPWMSESAARST